MSSGWNGIGIKSVGKTRRKLADLICRLTGGVCDPEDIERTNPNVRHYEDCCAWEVWVQMPNGRKETFHSWCTMADCVKHGIVIIGDINEFCANEKA
jgi:hypothetical protein